MVAAELCMNHRDLRIIVKAFQLSPLIFFFFGTLWGGKTPINKARCSLYYDTLFYHYGLLLIEHNTTSIK